MGNVKPAPYSGHVSANNPESNLGGNYSTKTWISGSGDQDQRRIRMDFKDVCKFYKNDKCKFGKDSRQDYSKFCKNNSQNKQQLKHNPKVAIANMAGYTKLYARNR